MSGLSTLIFQVPQQQPYYGLGRSTGRLAVGGCGGWKSESFVARDGSESNAGSRDELL